MKMVIKTDSDKAAMIRWVKELAISKGKEFYVEIERFHELRSLSQNRLYHAWLRCISHVTGNTPRELHKQFKGDYLPWYFESDAFEGDGSGISTTKLTTRQFTKFLEEIRQDMINNLDVTLPYPGEETWAAFYVTYGRIE